MWKPRVIPMNLLGASVANTFQSRVSSLWAAQGPPPVMIRQNFPFRLGALQRSVGSWTWHRPEGRASIGQGLPALVVAAHNWVFPPASREVDAATPGWAWRSICRECDDPVAVGLACCNPVAASRLARSLSECPA